MMEQGSQRRVLRALFKGGVGDELEAFTFLSHFALALAQLLQAIGALPSESMAAICCQCQWE